MPPPQLNILAFWWCVEALIRLSGRAIWSSLTGNCVKRAIVHGGVGSGCNVQPFRIASSLHASCMNILRAFYVGSTGSRADDSAVASLFNFLLQRSKLHSWNMKKMMFEWWHKESLWQHQHLAAHEGIILWKIKFRDSTIDPCMYMLVCVCVWLFCASSTGATPWRHLCENVGWSYVRDRLHYDQGKQVCFWSLYSMKQNFIHFILVLQLFIVLRLFGPVVTEDTSPDLRLLSL